MPSEIALQQALSYDAPIWMPWSLLLSGLTFLDEALDDGYRPLQFPKLPFRAVAIGRRYRPRLFFSASWLISLVGTVGLRFFMRSRKARSAFFSSSSAACFLDLRVRPIRASVIQVSLRVRQAMSVLLHFCHATALTRYLFSGSPCVTGNPRRRCPRVA